MPCRSMRKLSRTADTSLPMLVMKPTPVMKTLGMARWLPHRRETRAALKRKIAPKGDAAFSPANNLEPLRRGRLVRAVGAVGAMAPVRTVRAVGSVRAIRAVGTRCRHGLGHDGHRSLNVA